MSKITISTTIQASPKQVFDTYLNPEDNKRWNIAGGGWSTGNANIEPVVGGRSEVEYKSDNGKNDFMFGGTFTEIIPNSKISYTMAFPGIPDRNAEVLFTEIDGSTKVMIIFDGEDQNSEERQKEGWSAILANFKRHVERKANSKNAVILLNTTINASAKKIWHIMLDKDGYKNWTSAFCEGSYYEGEMKYNEKIRFLSPGGSGLNSVVKVCIPFWQVSFEHLGAINKGVDDFDSPDFRGWKGARETYTLTEVDGVTNLEIYQEVNTQEDDVFTKMWEQAFVNIRKLAEG